jgi:hypothetical protein
MILEILDDLCNTSSLCIKWICIPAAIAIVLLGMIMTLEDCHGVSVSVECDPCTTCCIDGEYQ